MKPRYSSPEDFHSFSDSSESACFEKMSKKGMKELQRKDFPSKRFDPFRRTDRYGPRGTTPQPPLEVARCVLVALALAPLKLLVTLSAVVFFYFVCR